MARRAVTPTRLSPLQPGRRATRRRPTTPVLALVVLVAALAGVVAVLMAIA